MTASFSTCDLCDAHKSASVERFRVLLPGWIEYASASSFCGVTQTVRCLDDNSLVKAAVESSGWLETPSGRVAKVLVVDGGGSMRRALLGGNLGAAAARNGWAGLVIAGCVRDVAELACLSIGIRALGHVPLPTERKAQGLADVPVFVGGAWVNPGDWVYADADGIVVSADRLHA